MLAGPAVAALALTACGSGGQTANTSGTAQAGTPGASGGPIVTVTTGPRLGAVLVTSQGRTLYEATASCTGECLRVWRPVVLPAGTSVPDAVRGVSGLTAVSHGGNRQLAYRGHPLYTFTGDTKPGQANGNGINSFGGHWVVATLSPATPATTPPRTSPSPAASPPHASPSPAASPSVTPAPGGTGYGDTDHDRDCRPGYGDSDHDRGCGPGQMGPGHSPGQMGPGHGRG